MRRIKKQALAVAWATGYPALTGLPLRAGMCVGVRAGRLGTKSASRPGRTILTKDQRHA